MPAQSMIETQPGYQPKRLVSGAPEAAQRSLAMRPSIEITKARKHEIGEKEDKGPIRNVARTQPPFRVFVLS
jgi:hypothetical protein